MNKDVIYIDVEDDVTAIIGKVKASREKVVALVPPKRTGVLQSAVNLRILQRTAKTAGKHIVLITNDSSLIPLAAGAGLPVAKNLQSKPEVPEIAALKVDDDDDIIDGSQLSIGEHVASGSKSTAAAKHIPVSSAPESKKYASPPKAGESPRKPLKNSGKVPNFSTFRKKLLFLVLGAIMLIGFLVWAIFFAPRATVEITAKTSTENVSTAATLSTTEPTDVQKGVLKALQAEEVKNANVEFEATGTETKGEKARGEVEFSTDSIRLLGKSIPAGTTLTSARGKEYITTGMVTFNSSNNEGVSTGIVASDIGEDYNGVTGSLKGAPVGVSAVISEEPTGGSKQTYKVVTQADVQAATEQLAQQNTDEIKAALVKRFPRNSNIIDSSFRTAKADVKANPEVGQEAPNGKATLTSSITYVMNAVATSEIEKFVDAAVEMKLSKENDQRIYKSGAAKAQLVDFAATETGGTANLTASAQVGPQIDDAEIKKRVAGKRFGEIQSDLESIPGVDNVDVKFWPFWVNTVPEKADRISIEFKLINSSSDES